MRTNERRARARVCVCVCDGAESRDAQRLGASFFHFISRPWICDPKSLRAKKKVSHTNTLSPVERSDAPSNCDRFSLRGRDHGTRTGSSVSLSFRPDRETFRKSTEIRTRCRLSPSTGRRIRTSTRIPSAERNLYASSAVFGDAADGRRRTRSSSTISVMRSRRICPTV